MKVGTITFHRAVNYGAVLQTYALCNVLSKLGVDAEVIDYRPNYLEKIYKPLSMRNVKTVKDFFTVLAGANIKRKKRNMFLNFIKNNVSLSKRHYFEKDLKDTNSIYDKFITGSDQVWNLDCSGYDRAYFLDFVEDSSKKNSYSASFGFEKLPKEWEDEYKELLSDYEKMSVRESQGVDIVKGLLDKDIEEVLDPTLLLRPDDWKKLVRNNVEFDNYILIYALKPSKRLISFAKELAKKSGSKIVFLKDSLTKENEVELFEDVEYVKMAPPEDFIELIMKAKYVITNSFHGTAFSINFNKQFFTEFLDPKMMVNSRLENILNMTGLRDRQLVDGSSVGACDIDYSRVNEVLEGRREKSMEFLKSIL